MTHCYHRLRPETPPAPKWVDEYKNLPMERLWAILTDWERRAVVKMGLPSDKDRYGGIKAFVHNAIKMEPAVPYFNGSLIKISEEREVVAMQAPTAFSLWDFAYMVVKRRVPAIYCFGEAHEGSKQKMLPYWTKARDLENQRYGEVAITPEEVIEEGDGIRVRYIIFEHEEEEVRVKHVHLWDWLDHSVPELSRFGKMLSKFLQEPNECMVHCSAGVGRTGTFLATAMALCDSTLADGEEKRLAFECTSRMKEARYYSVQAREQFEFIRDFLVQRSLYYRNV